MSSFVMLPPPERRRVSGPFLLSAGLHGALLVALLSASLNRTVTRISQDQAVMITMLNPSSAAAPAAAADAPQPVPEPESEAETVTEPAPPPRVPVRPELVQPKPQPRPKAHPKPKPVVKPKPRPRPESKPQPQPQPKPKTPAVSPAPSPAARSPFHASSGASPAPATPSRTGAGNSGVVHKGGPRPVSRQQPAYPPRAYAQHVEGSVRVQFDVDDAGRLINIQILSASPRNVFEGEVRRALRRWRYAPGQPGKNLVVNIEFRIDQYSRR